MLQILDHLNPQVCAQLKRAIELGKWPDGRPLTREQKGLCLQAVLLYEARELPPEQRTGHIDRRGKRGSCDSPARSADAAVIASDGVAGD